MPFRWKKKTRCNRFSQLVADHLQSPKHGGSLVVETGFPTSLIDLYVRNRGRFRKSAAKEPMEIDSPILSPSPSSSTSSGLLVDSINMSSSSSSSSLLVDSINLSSGALDHRERDEIVEEVVVVVGGGSGASSRVANDGEIKIENSSKTEVEKSDELVKLNPVLVVLLKVLLMLIIALGTKRFTVGITVSAFFLFFLELVGKSLLVRSSSITHRIDSKTPIESKSKQNTTPVVCSQVLSEIEEQVDSKQEVRSEKEIDEVTNENSIEIRHKISRKAIMKSKMKKLVPKKLRRPSMGSKDDLSCEFKDVKPLISSSKCSDSKGETLCILKQDQDKQSSSSTVSSKINCNDKESGTDLQQNSGYLVLFLIVLVGLIGGRFMATVLALSWCVMLKKSPKWSNVKFFNS